MDNSTYILAKERITTLQSKRIQGFGIFPGKNVVYRIIEWDKLLQHIATVSTLSKQKNSNFSSVKKFIKNYHIPINTKEIIKAHELRNAIAHDVNFNSSIEKSNILKAISILEQACVCIIKCYEQREERRKRRERIRMIGC